VIDSNPERLRQMLPWQAAAARWLSVSTTEVEVKTYSLSGVEPRLSMEQSLWDLPGPEGEEMPTVVSLKEWALESGSLQLQFVAKVFSGSQLQRAARLVQGPSAARRVMVLVMNSSVEV
jgi:hypothetical protein